MKPRLFLYNPPATLDPHTWLRPMPLNLLSACSLIDESEFALSVVQAFPEEAIEAFRRHEDEILCVGISAMTGHQITNGLAVARAVKSSKDVPIIWGGYHPTALPDQTLGDEHVDVVIRGYGEVAFREVVHRLARGQTLDGAPNISFRRNGDVVHVPEGPIPKLNDLPAIPYHLFDVEQFFRDTGKRSLHYISSRGCPHQCGFCADLVVYQRMWNAWSAERVVADLVRLKEEYDYDTVRFYDSNLFVNEARIRTICEGVLDHGLKFRWVKANGDAFVLARYRPETIRLMRQAGVENLLVGVESGHEPALKLVSKAASVEHNSRTVTLLHDAGISIGFSFMFGFPYPLTGEAMRREHEQELLATMRAIAQFSRQYIEGDYYLIFIFTPYPGVRLFTNYLTLGYAAPARFEDWSAVNLNTEATSLWVDPSLLVLHDHCVKLAWFFMRKLDRRLFGDAPRPGRVRTAIGDAVRAWLRRRINRGDLRLPLSLRLVMNYYRAKQFVQGRGWRALIGRLRQEVRGREPQDVP